MLDNQVSINRGSLKRFRLIFSLRRLFPEASFVRKLALYVKVYVRSFRFNLSANSRSSLLRKPSALSLKITITTDSLLGCICVYFGLILEWVLLWLLYHFYTNHYYSESFAAPRSKDDPKIETMADVTISGQQSWTGWLVCRLRKEMSQPWSREKFALSLFRKRSLFLFLLTEVSKNK